MAKPHDNYTSPSYPAVSGVTLRLDGVTPIRLSLGKWREGAQRTAVVGLCASHLGSTLIHPALGKLCAATSSGELVLELDPVAARSVLWRRSGVVWLVAMLSAFERGLAGDVWLPIPVHCEFP